MPAYESARDLWNKRAQDGRAPIAGRNPKEPAAWLVEIDGRLFVCSHRESVPIIPVAEWDEMAQVSGTFKALYDNVKKKPKPKGKGKS